MKGDEAFSCRVGLSDPDTSRAIFGQAVPYPGPTAPRWLSMDPAMCLGGRVGEIQ